MRTPKDRPAARKRVAPRFRWRSAFSASLTAPSRRPLSFLSIASWLSIPLSVHVNPSIASLLPFRPAAVEPCSWRIRARVRTSFPRSDFPFCEPRISATPRRRVLLTAASEAEPLDPQPASGARSKNPTAAPTGHLRFIQLTVHPPLTAARAKSRGRRVPASLRRSELGPTKRAAQARGRRCGSPGPAPSGRASRSAERGCGRRSGRRPSAGSARSQSERVPATGRRSCFGRT